MSLLLLLLAACAPSPEPTRDTGASVDHPDDATPPPPDDTGPGDDDPKPDPEYDCSVLPGVPAPFTSTGDWPVGEDFDLDGQGYLVSLWTTDIVGQDRAGQLKVISPDVASYVTGTRILPSGDVLINDPGNGTLVRIDAATGARELVATALDKPNGLEVDSAGYAFVSEENGDRVLQIDATTGEQWVVGAVGMPNGLILSNDEQTLFVANNEQRLLVAVDRLGPTSWGEPRIVRATSFFVDGVNVDICDNLYVLDFYGGRVVRITPDGAREDVVAELPDNWISNLRWGHDIGGWNRSTLYVAKNGAGILYEIDVGIPGKKHLLAP